MAKFNAIQFAASISADMSGEFDELIEEISACNAGEDKVEQLVRHYNHLNSFLGGVKYTITYIADEDVREDLLEVYNDQWLGMLQSQWAAIVTIKYTKQIDRNVRICTIHDCGATKYSLTVGEDEARTFTDRQSLINYLREYK